MADDIGCIASPPGVNVLTTPVRNLSFSSSFEMHKIKQQGENQPQTAFQIDHGLNYWPFFLHYRQIERSGGQINRWSLYTGHASLFTYYYIFYERSFI